MAMAQLALMRAERLTHQIAVAPPPSFKPSIADLVTLKPSPEQATRDLWKTLNPQAAAQERVAALDLLSKAAGATTALPPAPPAPGLSFSSPFLRPEPARPMRMQLAMEPKTGWKPGQGRPAPDPVADRLRGNMTQSLGSIIQDGMKAQLTAAAYPGWIQTGNYPWWWGTITGGHRQVEQMLAHDLAVYQRSWLPAITKEIATANISRAMDLNRRQWAAVGARTGEPVPH